MKTVFGIKGLPLTEYGIAANAVLGIRDSGKTYTATEATEELFDAGIPSIWLDPIGVAHNLRIPGKGRGYPIVVAGGRFGDLPLSVKNAGAIVRAAMQQGVSLVIDLFSTELSKADWRKIVRECVEILLYENHDYGLRHVFIEEAAEFVPQRVVDGQVFAAVEKLVRMGGNSKLGCTLINQRSEDLNKSVLELCANVFLHRQRGKNSLTGMKKWLDLLDPDEAKRIMESVPDLKSGECWVLSNELKHPVRIQIPEKNSLHPDRRAAAAPAGSTRRAVPADKFVDAMKASLAEKPKPVPTSKPVEKSNTAVDTGLKDRDAAFQAGIKQGRETGYPQGWLDGERSGFTRGVAAAANKMKSAIGDISAVPYEPGSPPKRIPASFTPTATPPIPSRPAAPASPSASRASGSVRERVLGALAELEAIGVTPAPRIQAALLSNYKHDGVPNFRNTAGALRTEGLVEYPTSSTIALTAAGRAAAPSVDAPLTNEDLHARITGLLGGVEGRIVQNLIGAYPNAVNRDDLAAESGYAHSGVPNFRNSLGRLRSLGFVEYPDTKTAKALPVLFVADR